MCPCVTTTDDEHLCVQFSHWDAYRRGQHQMDGQNWEERATAEQTAENGDFAVFLIFKGVARIWTNKAWEGIFQNFEKKFFHKFY